MSAGSLALPWWYVTWNGWILSARLLMQANLS
jgi:hypothetical protein